MDGSSEPILFTCTDGLTASVRFLGPETIELTLNGEDYQLQQERSASGARYVGPEAEFWNKGQESMLRIGELRYTCATAEEE